MTIARASLGEVNVQLADDGQLEPKIPQAFTSIEEYSRFKFGDGEASKKYGNMLGRLVLQDAEILFSSPDVYVSSSAYRVAPPASESLIDPFIVTANATAHSEGAETVFRHFKVSKVQMAPDNYAAMSYEERQATLQNDLILPEGLDLRGKHVVILDDIRVTGLREAALRNLLERAGVEHASFYYVLNASEGEYHPRTEAIINIRAMSSIDDAIIIAQDPNFIPNVRLCKFLLSRPITEVEKFFASVAPDITAAIIRYIKEDDLERVVKAIP